MDLSQLNKLSKTINTVINPNVYSHDADKINKPMEDIPFGHILNVNWDNIAANYGIIQYFLSQALYLDMASTEAEANKIVKRGTAGGIKVGDIYSTTGLESGTMPAGVGIAYKGNDNKIRYETQPDTIATRLGIKQGLKNLWSGDATATENWQQLSVSGAQGHDYLCVLWQCSGREVGTEIVFANISYTHSTYASEDWTSQIYYQWDGANTISFKGEWGRKAKSWPVKILKVYA